MEFVADCIFYLYYENKQLHRDHKMKRMQCQNCQSWINQDDASCSFCGHVLSQSASMPPSIAAEQPNTPPSIIRAAPQPTPPASSQPSPPNLPPPPFVSPTESPVSSPPPQVATVPSSPQVEQSFPMERKGGNCFKIGCGIVALLGFCLLASVGIVWGLLIAGYNAMPAAMPFDLPLVDQAPVDVENYLNTSICHLYVSPSDSDGWGVDLLGASDIIEPGYAYTIYVVPDQKYDIQVLDCDKNELDTVEGVKIGAGGYTYSSGSEE